MRNFIEKLFTGAFIKTKGLGIKTKKALKCNKGEGFVDTALKILISVVIGGLLLAGLYLLFKDTVLPTLTQKITDMFDFKG